VQALEQQRDGLLVRYEKLAASGTELSKQWLNS